MSIISVTRFENKKLQFFFNCGSNSVALTKYYIRLKSLESWQIFWSTFGKNVASFVEK